MAEFSSVTIQNVAPNAAIVFTENPVPCRRGLVLHRDDTGSFLLKGFVPRSYSCGCGCNQRARTADYLVDFGANIAIPTDGTVGSISVALAIDGTPIPSSEMIVTPAAVEQYFNVSRAINAAIFAGCCQSVSVINTSTQPILVQDANIIFSRPDLAVTR